MIIFYDKTTGNIISVIDGLVTNEKQEKITISVPDIPDQNIDKYIVPVKEKKRTFVEKLKGKPKEMEFDGVIGEAYKKSKNKNLDLLNGSFDIAFGKIKGIKVKDKEEKEVKEEQNLNRGNLTPKPPKPTL